jgi:hypothetical protein
MLLWKLYLKLLNLADIYNRVIIYRWWFYVERMDKRISQKTDLPVYMQKILTSSSSRNRYGKTSEI